MAGISKALVRTDRTGEITEIVIPSDPVPAARPRVGRWGTYYPKSYARWKAATRDMLIEHSSGSYPSDEDFHVAVHVVCAKPKTGKLPHPKGDVDNYVKAVLDAITNSQLVWSDDKQIVTLKASKRYALGGEPAHAYVKASKTLGGLWLDEVDWIKGDDVYDLPESMRVPTELLDDL